MQELQLQIMGVVEKTLPSLQANEFKKFFTDYEESKKEIQRLQACEVSSYELELSLRKELREQDSILKANGDLRAKIEVLDGQIAELQTKLRNANLTSEKEKTDMMYNLISMVFKTPKKVSEFNTTNTDVVSHTCYDYNTGKPTSQSSHVQITPIKTTAIESVE